ncbi:hypothetical protein ACAS46_000916 [Vibrio vulnificus]
MNPYIQEKIEELTTRLETVNDVDFKLFAMNEPEFLQACKTFGFNPEQHYFESYVQPTEEELNHWLSVRGGAV